MIGRSCCSCCCLFHIYGCQQANARHRFFIASRRRPNRCHNLLSAHACSNDRRLPIVAAHSRHASWRHRLDVLHPATNYPHPLSGTLDVSSDCKVMCLTVGTLFGASCRLLVCSKLTSGTRACVRQVDRWWLLRRRLFCAWRTDGRTCATSSYASMHARQTT